jgi:cytochrome c553
VPNYSIALVLFGLFAIGLPLYGMQNNSHSPQNIHGCSGECYEAWKAETGGIIALQAAAAQAKAEASPEELGKAAYAGCIACHGADGEGGVGPQLAGQSAATIVDKLTRYKNGETLGNQSSLMWGQAGMLSDSDIEHIAAFVETL